MNWVTSPGSLVWTNDLEVQRQLWVKIIVIEALVGTNTLEALGGLDGDQYDDGFLMSEFEVE